MAIEVAWGSKLGLHELQEREREFDICAGVLERWARKKLKRKGINVVSVNARPAACINCPEFPGECHLCRIDAACDAQHRKVALEIVIEEEV